MADPSSHNLPPTKRNPKSTRVSQKEKVIPYLDLKLSLGEGSKSKNVVAFRSRPQSSLLSLLKSSSAVVLSPEEEEAVKEEKKRTRDNRTMKRSEARTKKTFEIGNAKFKALTAAMRENPSLQKLENVAADLTARAIASASQSAALFDALVKIQNLQKRAVANLPMLEAPPVLAAAPLPQVNPTSFQPLKKNTQSEPIIYGGVASKQAASLDQFPTSSSMLTAPMMKPTNFHSFLDQTHSEPIIPNAMANVKPINLFDINVECTPAKKAKTLDLMTQMPGVKATVDGPDGRKIEGHLSQWLNGQVVIVCHCHGSYLTPEEFLEHAGRTNVENPMQHITVCFSPKAL